MATLDCIPPKEQKKIKTIQCNADKFKNLWNEWFGWLKIQKKNENE